MGPDGLIFGAFPRRRRSEVRSLAAGQVEASLSADMIRRAFGGDNVCRWFLWDGSRLIPIDAGTWQTILK